MTNAWNAVFGGRSCAQSQCANEHDLYSVHIYYWPPFSDHLADAFALIADSGSQFCSCTKKRVYIPKYSHIFCIYTQNNGYTYKKIMYIGNTLYILLKILECTFFDVYVLKIMTFC